MHLSKLSLATVVSLGTNEDIHVSPVINPYPTNNALFHPCVVNPGFYIR